MSIAIVRWGQCLLDRSPDGAAAFRPITRSRSVSTFWGVEQVSEAFGGESIGIDRVSARAFTIPTVQPESDGTLGWDSTTLVAVELRAGGVAAFGYSYTDAAAATLINGALRPLLTGASVVEHPRLLRECLERVRNLGQGGTVAMAISAVDAALWDLKGRLLGLPVAAMLGVARMEVEVYGSGGFTSLSTDGLVEQLAGWTEQGIRRVKMKVGREPERDFERARIAREAIGPNVELFVDANGGYSEKQALELAEAFSALSVRWFEEPVSSESLESLNRIRTRLPAGMECAAGEYADGPRYVRRMLQANAVDVMQADATRCLGITGLMEVAALCDAFEIPLSTHCAPSLHLHVSCAVPRFRHLEFFFDHARIERRLFDGFVEPVNGVLRPDLTRPGLGFDFKHEDAEQFAV